MTGKLFPVDLPELQWLTFPAEGFERPVAGAIFHAGQSSCGLPLGGIGTGCIDLDTDGTLGRCSIFNTFVPPRVLEVPFLTLSVGSQVWGLTTRQIPGIGHAKQIHYWGHYPVADLEFEIDGPVEAGLRAWSVFLPGDATASNTPAACFEVHLRNRSNSPVNGSLVFTFPGPSDAESGAQNYEHLQLNGVVRGVHVATTRGNGYVLSVLTQERVQTGGGLANEPSSWAGVCNEIPKADIGSAGATIKVDYALEPGEERTFPVILAWYFPRWAGSAEHHFRHAYSECFRNAAEVAEYLARNRAPLLARILRWQSEIYAAADLPVWLRDQLVNILHTIPKDSFWASDSIPPEEWYTPTGIFGLTESSRTTPHICNPSDWYGGLPIVFFFPELAGSLLRAYAHFQLTTGEIPIGIGDGADLEKPEYRVIPVMNSLVHVQLVDRLWQRDLNEGVLHEFYPSVKRAINYTKGLDRDGDGLPDVDPDPIPNHYYGNWPWYGAAIHVAGLWLVTLRMAERMAQAVGDSGFAKDCQVWFETGRRSLEQKLWGGEWYLLYNDLDTGKRSDTILANQLAGQLCAYLHGLQPIVKSDRVDEVLTIVKQRLVPATPYGVVNAIRPDGSFDTSGSPHSDGIFTGECACVAMTIGYAGDWEAGNKVAQRQMQNIVFGQGAAWDMPNIVHALSGKIIHGHDFYQMMILWGLPLAMSKHSIHQACRPDGLIGRVLSAARVQSGE